MSPRRKKRSFGRLQAASSTYRVHCWQTVNTTGAQIAWINACSGRLTVIFAGATFGGGCGDNRAPRPQTRRVIAYDESEQFRFAEMKSAIERGIRGA